VYVTGGLAYGDVTTTASLLANGAFVALKTDAIKVGGVIGGGVETFVWNGWTVKLEYLYIDFGNIGTAVLPGIAPITIVAASSRVTDQIVRVGFNYHFGPGTP
jgi:outer membrane immunogenic protein